MEIFCTHLSQNISLRWMMWICVLVNTERQPADFYNYLLVQMPCPRKHGLSPPALRAALSGGRRQAQPAKAHLRGLDALCWAWLHKQGSGKKKMLSLFRILHFLPAPAPFPCPLNCIFVKLFFPWPVSFLHLGFETSFWYKRSVFWSPALKSQGS